MNECVLCPSKQYFSNAKMDYNNLANINRPVFSIKDRLNSDGNLKVYFYSSILTQKNLLMHIKLNIGEKIKPKKQFNSHEI